MFTTFIITLLSVCVVWLIIQNVSYEKRCNEALAKNVSQEKYYEQIWRDNETLRSYMDNQHLCWNDGMMDFFDRVPKDRGLLVLIRGDDLYSLYNDRWAAGHELATNDATVEIQRLQQSFEECIGDLEVTNITPFSDPRFDHDIAMFVNAISDTARRYSPTQQLRERMAHIVIEFRKYLTKKQYGEKPIFPRI